MQRKWSLNRWLRNLALRLNRSYGLVKCIGKISGRSLRTNDQEWRDIQSEE